MTAAQMALEGLKQLNCHFLLSHMRGSVALTFVFVLAIWAREGGRGEGEGWRGRRRGCASASAACGWVWVGACVRVESPWLLRG